MKTGILLMLLFFLVIRAVAQSKDTLLPEVTVKGTLTNKSGFKSTSIDSLMLALHSNTDLARLLSSSSTVFVKTYGPGNLATTSFRGAAAHHTEVLWEGISIKYPMSGQIDFSLIPVGAFDQVELFHGPGSLNNVTGALGGSINLSSSPDWNNKLCAAITQRAASYDNHSTNAVLKTGNDRMQSHSKLFIHTGRNDFPFRNITLAEQPVQTVQNAKQLQYNVLQDIFLSINRKNIISVRSWYQWSDREIPSPMTTSSAEEKQRDEAFRLQAEWKRINSKSTVTNRTAYLYSTLLYLNPMAGIVSDNRCYSLKDQFRLNYYFNPRISAKGGIDLDYEQAVADGYSKVETRTRGAVFADADYMPGKKLKLNLLLRQELVDNYLAPIVPSFSAEFKPLKKGLFVLMANASRNFKAPALNDLYWSPGGNPSLRPEEGFSAEAGIAYSTGPSRKLRVEVEITNYHAVISNWILWQPASNGFWGADNLRKVYNRGVEVSMKGTADLRNFKFLLQGNYEYVRAENKLTFSQLDASKGKQLIYVPLHKGNAGLRIIYKRIFAGSDLVFTGLRYITTDNTWLLPSYNTADIFVGANFKFAKLELSTLGRVNNIWNEVYQAIAWRPMPGRNFEISLRFAFIK